MKLKTFLSTSVTDKLGSHYTENMLEIQEYVISNASLQSERAI